MSLVNCLRNRSDLQKLDLWELIPSLNSPANDPIVQFMSEVDYFKDQSDLWKSD